MPLGAFRLNTLSRYITSASGITPFLLVGTGTSTDASPYSIDVDSSGNIYATGSNRSSSSAGIRPWVSKFNSDGAEQWYVRYGFISSSYAVYPAKNSIMATDTRVSVGWYGSYDSRYSGIFLLDASDGSKLAQHKFYQTSANAFNTIGSYVDSNGRLTTISMHDSYYLHQAAYDTNGTLYHAGARTLKYGSSIKTSSSSYSNDGYLITKMTMGSGTSYPIIWKLNGYDSAPSWKRTIDNGSASPRGVAADSNNNVYTLLYESSQIQIEKSNGSTVSWTIDLTSTSTHSPNWITTDGTYVYVTSKDYAPGYGLCTITAIDCSNGSIVWCNGLSKGTNNIYFDTFKVINNTIYAIGEDTTDDSPVIFRIPADGSGTGNYGSYSYSANNNITSSTRSNYSGLSSFSSGLTNTFTTDTSADHSISTAQFTWSVNNKS